MVISMRALKILRHITFNKKYYCTFSPYAVRFYDRSLYQKCTAGNRRIGEWASERRSNICMKLLGDSDQVIERKILRKANNTYSRIPEYHSCNLGTGTQIIGSFYIPYKRRWSTASPRSQACLAQTTQGAVFLCLIQRPHLHLHALTDHQRIYEG